ncbi:polysaccharide lyase domain-containing protein [Pochonia chlamydosporia 170]|uniref:Polysaccharide lyase domain-containing protein n=1 Tax=Pochonia chlamydosporia 170 TaxID=1380566 RepID=A0A179EYN2_METCM|nr:polysaccharide lyase domain-containing protein [Pochonia chlamydosporia 170]OAQ58307.1 polysaccharide lyase domain-containing protein [Pochonia chlamydosporia 170]
MRGILSRLLVLAVTGLASAKIIFQDDFEGDLSQWKSQGCPGGVVKSADVARTGKFSAKLVVHDNDTNAVCPDSPTENPRAQLVSPPLFKDGDEYYIGFSVLFPSGFPKISNWFMFFELYGPPYNGTPSMALFVSKENKLTFGRDAAYNRDTIWTGAPIVPGQWRDIALRVKFSTDPEVGFVQIWDGGKQQELVGGNGTTVVYRTLNPEVNWNGSPNTVVLNQYRSKDTNYGPVTLYHDSVKVGTSLEEVAPNRGGGRGSCHAKHGRAH